MSTDVLEPEMIRPSVVRAAITAETMLPDLLTRYPQARAVLKPYGLRGCSRSRPPVESIRSFARLHQVDEARLLSELSSLIANALPSDGECCQDDQETLENSIYRRFFIGGVLCAVTAGAGWGVMLLWQLARVGRFTGLPLQQVNAHGQAEVYGWVGLFIMGFAYQVFPRLWHTTLAWPKVAAQSFVCMLVGIALRSLAMVASTDSWALSIQTVGGSLQVAAIGLFAVQLLVTFRRSEARLEPYIGFIFAAMGFFVVQAAFDLWHSYRTMVVASSMPDLLWQVATYQAPLRDMQIHGVALLIILGVSLRMLPAMYTLPRISPWRAWGALGGLLLAVVAEVTLFIAYRMTGNHWLAASLMIPWLVLLIGSAAIVMPWKPWRPWLNAQGKIDRTAKFIRASYGWLALSLVMLLLMPVYLAFTSIPFSHAYYGAVRHAITVGFVSLMIMGFASKVVPNLNGIDPRRLSSLRGPFLLINAGCAWRVVTQIGTDLHPVFYHAIGVSGVLELTALVWWGWEILRLLTDRHSLQRSSPRVSPPELSVRIGSPM